MLPLLHIDSIKNSHNLLAFSGGVDSTSLFFLLLHYNIPFDIAFVNYHKRQESQQEEHYAQSLALKFNKRIFTYSAPNIQNNFEHNARNIRYIFFERIIEQEKYHNLLLAHQLNDRLEWFILSLCKGSGIDSAVGSSACCLQYTASGICYTKIRPLWNIPKDKLYDFLHTHHIEYFEDSTNYSSQYQRNIIRHQYAQPMIKQYALHIAKSFEILEKERNILYPNIIQRHKNLFIFSKQTFNEQNIHYIDKACKQLGYVLSVKQRVEIIKQDYNLVLAHTFAIGSNDNFIFIAPYIQAQTISKSKREYMRKLKIPPNIRPYIYKHIEPIESLTAIIKNKLIR